MQHPAPSATTVTVVRRTPSICDKNSWVSLIVLLSSRSRACSSQRLQPGLDRMQCVAGGGLLNLDQQHLAVAHDDLADGFALLGNLAEARRRNARGRPPDLNDGTRVRPAHSKSGEGAHRTLVTDRRGFDGVALPHHRQQRDDPIMGKIDLVDAIPLLLQNGALPEDDVLQLGASNAKSFAREAKPKADCACPDPVPPSAFLIGPSQNRTNARRSDAGKFM